MKPSEQHRKKLLGLYSKFKDESVSNTEIRRKIKLELRKEKFDEYFRFLASLQYRLEDINIEIEYTKNKMKYDVDLRSKLFNKEYKSTYGLTLRENYQQCINKMIDKKRQLKVRALFLLNDYVINTEMSKRGIDIKSYKRCLELEEF